MGHSAKRRIVVPAAPQQRRASNKRRSTKPEWLSASLVDAAIVIGATLATTLFLLLISGQLHDTTAENLIAQSPAPASSPIVAAQPTPTPEQSLIGHATPSPQPSRSAASPGPAESETTANAPDDAAIQAAIEKKLQDNADLSSFGITITISGGTVTVVGTVPSDEAKEKIEKLVRAVKGVKQVDNQIVVVSGT